MATTKINVTHHVHSTNEYGNPIYDMSTEPWNVVYNDKTASSRVDSRKLFPNDDGDLHWFGIPKPKALTEDHRLVRVDYNGDDQVDAYWQNIRPVDHRILDTAMVDEE